MNRRGNGLSAEAYTALADLSPHLADLMLTALRDAGIAAYVNAPDDAGADSGPAASSTLDGPVDEADAEPFDRLYVDTDVRQTAEGVLRTQLRRLSEEYAHGPGAGGGPDPGSARFLDAGDGSAAPDDPALTDLPDLPGLPDDPAAAADGSGAAEGPGEAGPAEAAEPTALDEAAIWAEIVAGFDEPPAEGALPWPDEENLSPGESGERPARRPGGRDDDRPDDERGDSDAEGQDGSGLFPTARVIKSAGPDFDGEGHDEDESRGESEDEEHYVPPPPPPLPTGDAVTRFGWLALVGGPLYILVAVLLGWEVPGWAAFTAVAAFIGGFVTLVLRMGDDPRGPDDGAVV